MNLPLFEPEVTANLERAEESLRAAQLLKDAGHWDFAAARAYYAAFYAATAALLGEGREYHKHSGVIADIHKFLVKTGKLDKEHGKNLNWLFELRSIGDYGDIRHVPQEDAARAIAVAQSFVAAIKKLLPRPE
ncbi:MAG: HEPN domain-containing protein [Desulfobaccales bacterium]